MLSTTNRKGNGRITWQQIRQDLREITYVICVILKIPRYGIMIVVGCLIRDFYVTTVRESGVIW